MTTDPESVAVYGPGLMGSSLLMALRARCPVMKLGAWARREDALEELRARGLIDFSSTDPAEVAASSAVVVLCLPVDKMGEVAARLAGALKADAVVTDVGSVKRELVNELEACFEGHDNFVGSHPMCGSEEAGLGAARPDLYEGAVCVVTPTNRSRTEVVRAVRNLWELVGARVLEMDPVRHDRAAALASHVPHVVAAMLVELAWADTPEARALCAGGFRDTTRVASGPADLWTAILSQNRTEVARALGLAADQLQSVKSALEQNNLDEVKSFLASAVRHRSQIVGAV
jgi:prephenate dehydrogenase